MLAGTTGKELGRGDKSEMGEKEEFKRKETFFLCSIKCEVISGTVATIVATLRDRANMRRNPEVKRTKNIRQKS